MYDISPTSEVSHEELVEYCEYLRERLAIALEAISMMMPAMLKYQFDEKLRQVDAAHMFMREQLKSEQEQ